MSGYTSGKADTTHSRPVQGVRGARIPTDRVFGDAPILGKVSTVSWSDATEQAAGHPAVAGVPRAGRLIVVSNRVADSRQHRQAGGLAVAVSETLRATGGIWFGWSGAVREGADKSRPSRRRSEEFDLVTLDLTPEERAGYYHGFANQSLWPLLHYRSDLVRFDRDHQNIYNAVNRRFAETVAALLRPDDVVWVHDFHLLPLGAELRRLGCHQAIGFFLHVPFPPGELVATLPDHRDVFGDLLAYDLIGFQTERDAECFRAYARTELPGGGYVNAGAFPVGIDVDAFAAQSCSGEAERHIQRIRNSLADRALIVGVDRLDYSKGLPQRLSAYRRFLRCFPEHRSRVVLMQVTPPSREELDPYSEIRRELDGLEGAIHGEFAEFDWTPVRYIRRSVSRDRLAALHRIARACLVTPLRDGMNLVAKEFVAAQNPDDPGVLILSCFAGAAASMDEALIVNPYDIDQIATALKDALSMTLQERRARHSALLASIRSQDVHAWRRAFLGALTVAPQRTNGIQVVSTNSRSDLKQVHKLKVAPHSSATTAHMVKSQSSRDGTGSNNREARF